MCVCTFARNNCNTTSTDVINYHIFACVVTTWRLVVRGVLAWRFCFVSAWAGVGWHGSGRGGGRGGGCGGVGDWASGRVEGVGDLMHVGMHESCG